MPLHGGPLEELRQKFLPVRDPLSRAFGTAGPESAPSRASLEEAKAEERQKERTRKAMASFRYMLQTHKETGKRISPVEAKSELANFELTGKNALLGQEMLEKLGIGEIESRVRLFRSRRSQVSDRVQAQRIKEAGDERRLQEASFAAAELQHRADMGRGTAQRELDMQVQPRLGIPGLGTKSPVRIMDEAFQRGQEKVFDFSRLNNPTPFNVASTALITVIGGIGEGYLQHTRSQEWAAIQSGKASRGEYDSSQELVQLSKDTLGASGNLAIGIVELLTLGGASVPLSGIKHAGRGAAKTFGRVTATELADEVSQAVRKLDAKQLAHGIRKLTGASPAIAIDVAKGLKKADADGALPQIIEGAAKALPDSPQKAAQASTPTRTPLEAQKAVVKGSGAQTQVSGADKASTAAKVQDSGSIRGGSISAVLPEGLQKSTPRYGFKDKTFALKFASDYDKAAYIVAGKGQSKAHKKFVKWLADNDLDLSEAVRRGEEIRAEVKAVAKDAETGTTITVGKAVPKATGKKLSETIAEGGNAIDARIATVQARRDARLKGTKKRKKTAGFEDIGPEDLKDAAELGALFIAKGVTKFAEWSVAMVEVYGAGIKPHLRKMWVAARTGDVDTVSKRAVADTLEDRATGIANQVQFRETEQGLINAVSSATGKSTDEWMEAGRELYELSLKGEFPSPQEMAIRIARGEETATGDLIGFLIQGKRALRNRLDQARAALDLDPTSKELAHIVDSIETEMDVFTTNIQAGVKGPWSDVGRAMQGGLTLDEGSVTDVLQAAKRAAAKGGRELDAKSEARITELVADLNRKDAQIEALRQGGSRADADVVVKEARTKKKFDKAALGEERAQLYADLKEVLSRPTGGSVGSGLGGFTPGQFRVTQEVAEILKDLTANYVKSGIATLEEVVVSIKNVLREQFGIDASDQDIIDAIGLKGDGTPATDIQKKIAALKREAARESTPNKARIQTEIDELQEQLASKTFIEPPKKPKPKKTTELELLEAERDVARRKVRAAIEDEKRSKAARALRSGAQAVRQYKLGTDIGTLTRQGLFTWGSPRNWPAGVRGLKEAFKAIVDERMVALWERNSRLAKTQDGRSLEAIRKKAGLNRSDSVLEVEELISLQAAKKIPYIGQLFGKLGDAQLVFINTVRNEIFDTGVRAGLSEVELATRAHFVNNATGRGNIKSVPTWLQVIMTAPRYESSRWGILGEPFVNIQKAVKGDKGARRNLEDMGTTAASLFALYKAAELAGYETEWDVLHPDFGKLRKGDKVWDVTAGLAPRLRDSLRLLSLVFSGGDVFQSSKTIIGGSAVRTISPAVRLSGGVLSTQTQKALGAEEPRDPFSGWETEDDEWWQLASPLVIGAAIENWQAEGPLSGMDAALKEFIGGGISRYPKPDQARWKWFPQDSGGSIDLPGSSTGGGLPGADIVGGG